MPAELHQHADNNPKLVEIQNKQTTMVKFCVQKWITHLKT